jgi:hypothetical protein
MAILMQLPYQIFTQEAFHPASNLRGGQQTYCEGSRGEATSLFLSRPCSPDLRQPDPSAEKHLIVCHSRLQR